jgi:enoyl-CoA hydratase
MSAELETLLVTRPTPNVAVVCMNRPERGNGVVPAMARELLSLLTELEENAAVRAVILTGSGRVFSAGADLHAFHEYLETDLAETHEPFNARVLFPVTQQLVTSRLPFVAAVNGAATAGGLDLALACDVRLASSEARFGETYVKIGLAPGNGGTYFLPRLVGSGRAAELALTGDLIDASRALEIGLVNRVVEPQHLLDEAVALATRIAANPARAVEATKQALRASWHMDLSSVLATSYWTVAALQHTPDLREGVEAFLEKRPPRFQGVATTDGDERGKGGDER